MDIPRDMGIIDRILEMAAQMPEEPQGGGHPGPFGGPGYAPPAPGPAAPPRAYDICYLMGNCSMGRGRSLYGAKGNGGKLRHAVTGWKALCGATYGRRSAGWSEHEEGAAVTCPKCAKKIERLRST